MYKPIVDIFVVGYGLPEIEGNCLSSVVKNTSWPYVLTFLDNYNTKFSLTEVWNTFVEGSKQEFIILLNNDTEAHSNWLSRMMEVMLLDSKVAFAGPATDNCHSPQKDYTYALSESYLGKEDEFVYMQEKHLSGFCLCMRKKVWEEIGGFDERYFLYGQESAAQDAAYALNYKSVFVRSAFVHHIGEASVKASGMDVEKERTKAKELYWSERKKGQ